MNVKQVNIVKENTAKLKISRLVARPETVILLATIVVIIVSTINNSTFISMPSIVSMLNNISYTGIIAVPLVFLLIARFFDMSIGSATGLLSMVLAASIKYYNFPVFLGVLLVIACALLIGFINSTLIVKAKINAFIATIATMYICRGLMQVIGGEASISALPKYLTSLGNNTFLGLPINVYVFFILVLVGGFVLEFTVFGKAVYALGNNEEIAKIAGINVKRVKKILFFLTPIACSIAAFFLTVNHRSAMVDAGTGWEFQVTAGCMLGGCSMYGGKGSVFGGVLGVAFMSILSFSFQSMNVDPQLQTMLLGFLLILAVFIDTLKINKMNA